MVVMAYATDSSDFVELVGLHRSCAAHLLSHVSESILEPKLEARPWNPRSLFQGLSSRQCVNTICCAATLFRTFRAAWREPVNKGILAPREVSFT